MIKDINVPDIGDFDEVEIIEIHVSPGEKVEVEQSLITLESDKATMEIPSPHAGTVKEINIKTGQNVSQGDLILKLETEESSKPNKSEEKQKKERINKDTKKNVDAEVVVLGAGPGGYTAAFRAADLGLKTILIERYPSLGGVCLNVGCIPSKALLHVSKVKSEIDELKEQGIELGSGNPDSKSVRRWTESIINKLTSGLKGMATKRKIEVIEGCGSFSSPNSIEINNDGNIKTITFDSAIIAAGSQASKLSFLPDDPRIMDSTDALFLKSIPKRMLVIGGGIIGLEMATVYASMGSKITVVEMLDSLIAGCDKDIVRPLQKRFKKIYENIYLKTGVTSVTAQKEGLEVNFEGKDAPEKDQFDAILVAVGRSPNGKKIGADKAGVKVDEHGFIPVDNQQRTNIPHIFAIGDIVGQPMLAHKATHEGKLAAEVIAGHKAGFDDRVIPSVAYTDPEIAWCGLTESEARIKSIKFEVARFPWLASGRAHTLGRTEGLTKLILQPGSKRLLGVGIVGYGAGELISEGVLAINMKAKADDLSRSIHPHPTLSETIMESADLSLGTATHIYKRPRK